MFVNKLLATDKNIKQMPIISMLVSHKKTCITADLSEKLHFHFSQFSAQRLMDQYTILGRIGEGAHGIVFKAKHIEVEQV